MARAGEVADVAGLAVNHAEPGIIAVDRRHHDRLKGHRGDRVAPLGAGGAPVRRRITGQPAGVQGNAVPGHDGQAFSELALQVIDEVLALANKSS